MLFKGVLIGLELREFDKTCTMRLVFLPFGKNQSYEVLTKDMCICSKFFKSNNLQHNIFNCCFSTIILDNNHLPVLTSTSKSRTNFKTW